MLQRIKEVQESDLRMLGSLARNIQRVLPVTQADIDTAAAQGKAWVVKPVVKVSDPIDNLRGGTQLVIKQNAILPGQNVMRVMYVGGTAVVVGPAVSPVELPDAIANSLSYVKAFGGAEQRNLPDNYVQRQFIYMMDNSYLVPDIIPESDWYIEMDFQTTSVSTAGVRTYFGGRYDGSSAGAGIRLAHTGDRKVVMYGFDTNNAYTGSTYNMENDTRYKYVYNNGSASLSKGGTVVESTTFTPNDTTTSAVGINSYRNSNGGYSSTTEGIYLYSFKAWNGQGELVINIVPAVQKGTVPVVGFYDTVSGTFKTATTGTFAAGGEAVPTPDAPMNIVSNNGVLKVKDSELPLGYRRVLGYACDNDVLWQITDFHLRGSDTVRISFSVNAACNVFGCYQGASADDNYDLYVSTSSGSKYLRYGDGLYLSYWSSSDLGRRFNVVFTPNGTDGMPQDSTWTPLTFESENDLIIGSTTLTGSSAKLKGNLYGNFIVDGRLKLIPCERVSDGVLGYYDTYSNTFFEPTGTPTSLGYDTSYMTQVYADGTVETIEDTIGNTATAEMLLKIGNSQDEQEILTGAVTRNVQVIIFDGTESFSTSSAYGDACVTTGAASRWNCSKAVTPICTHFLGLPQASGFQPVNTCFFNASGHFYFRLEDNTVATFKAWLAAQYANGTPVMVLVALVTPTTESVAGQTLQVTDGDNVLEITQAGMAGLELEVEYLKD